MRGIRQHRALFIIVVFVLILLGGALATLNLIFAPDMFDHLLHFLGYVPFAVLMAVLLVLLVVIGRFLWRRNSGGILLCTFIALLEITYGTFIVRHVVTEEIHRYIQKLVNQTADLVTVEVDARLRFRLFALTQLSETWQYHQSPTKETWTKNVNEILTFFPGFQAIEWIDNSNVIRWAEPLEGNEKVLGLNVTFEPTRKHALEAAKKDESLIVTQSLTFVQGGRGFLTYVPIIDDGEFHGFIAGVITYQKLFDQLFNSRVVPGYSVAVYVDNEKVYQRGESDARLDRLWGSDVYVDFKGLQLHFRVWPTKELVGHEGRLIPAALILMGVLMGLLVLLGASLVLLMQRYTRRLLVMNQNLRLEMKERQEAEDAREKMKHALMQSQKLEAIGTLAGGIAHNFNNILYSVRGYVEMAREDLGQETQIHKNLGKVLEAVLRGQELVKGILSFSRQESYQFDLLKASMVLESTIQLLRSTLPATLELDVKNELGDATIVGNHTQLQQVLMNIIRNGVDAMDKSGEMHVIAYVETSEKTLHSLHPGLPYSTYVVIEVKDRGHGMDDETLQRIFEPFYTTKDIDKGTGLGLSTARSIIQDHKGEIVVKSQVEKGTEFFILLPESHVMEEKNHG